MQKVVTSPSGMILKKLLQCRVPPQGCRITNVPVTFMAQTKRPVRGPLQTTRQRTVDSSQPPRKGTSTQGKYWG